MAKKIIFIFALLHLNFFAQERVVFFPNGLNFKPYAANILEPRVGFMFELDKNYLRLDIGNSIDLTKIYLNEKEKFSFGADFFTYTLLRSQNNFKFPVEAVDYLFGLNFAYINFDSLKNIGYGSRLRISHISSHLSDGRFDNVSFSWKDQLNPFVYSREFFELSFYYEYNNAKIYLGASYLFHIIPKNIKRDEYFAGVEYFANFISSHFLPYFAYNIKINHFSNEYYVNHNAALGSKLGTKNGRGISLYLSYYKGKNFHGPLYLYDKNYVSLGFNVDL